MANFLSSVCRMSINHQENRPLGIVNQADEKIDKYFRTHSALGDHEAHLPLRADGRYEVKSKARPRGGNDWRFAAFRPSCSAMIVRAHTGFITKVDFGLRLARPRPSAVKPSSGLVAVVTKDVPDYALMVGNPAKQIGYVCQCKERLNEEMKCPSCNRVQDCSDRGFSKER